ncbi:nickel-dependent hydrogenase large subunit [Desulfurivibrio dismutans]|uniref:nickel-dependent hydrogenase large subunit n=1 Tax=Desulfurivibrio dismutans TaxID=1398908 RepID=UPI0023DBC39C|nr:nickel-dependent hydrogenase large subunit [Desulfurivibrio alkaliphilus]MDF1615594.1 nickel-dependent hydrogenase large subunit [Desulfurivibrio alkaliphilus]
MNVDIGPITRIEGHLNVKTTVENGVVIDARCEGEMFRGFEIFLRGRDPLDSQQITQRICGVCPYAHAIASSTAQENAYRLNVPPNGRILHNLIQGANHLYDYLLHFYQLCALDYVDITAVLEYTGKDPELSKVRDWVKAEVDSGKRYPAAPFLPRLSGKYLNNRDANLGAIKNYLEAMRMEQKANQAAAIFGGKFPHATSIFPGGCTQEARIDLIVPYQSLIREVRDFIHHKYIPDVLAVAGAFPEYWDIGRSQGGFLSYGHMPLGPEPDSRRLLAPGVLFNGEVTAVDFNQIRQDVNNAKYSSPTNLQVRDAAITPQPNKRDAYSWIMAPRYAGKMLEVGPAARVLVDYTQGHNPTVKELVDRFASQAGIRPAQLNSVLGRHLSRAILAAVLADFLLAESQRLAPGQPTMAAIDPPASAEGFGATEASRGALLHYIRIENYKIAKYECVVPTTWNASPRDDQGQPGAMESALIGTRVNNPEEQIESKRIVRSFDPCLACAVH